jgi:anion-transporting  ArsA/GET3 family ATPase
VNHPIAPILEEGRLIVCAGPGGVGKTTSAAALGLQAALRGRRCIVLTIDPAKRLANSLGLDRLTNAPQRIDLDERAETDDGGLWAMMLDQTETFEELLRRNAPDSASLERSRSNDIYRLMSTTLHGIQEYAALEKLHELYTSGDFDLVVLDTPPTANALDFLDAPKRLRRFFDRRVMKWFLPDEQRSSGLVSRFFNPGTVVLKLLRRFLGDSFVDELVEFFDTFQYLQETLEERGELIEYILADANTHFLVITSPDPRRIEEAFHFRDKLSELDQHVSAFVVNRVTPPFDEEDLEGLDADDLQQLRRPDAPKLEAPQQLLEALRDHYGALARLARRDRHSLDRLAGAVGEDAVQSIPILGEDVHSIDQLRILGSFLTPKAAS